MGFGVWVGWEFFEGVRGLAPWVDPGTFSSLKRLGGMKFKGTAYIEDSKILFKEMSLGNIFPA